MKHKFEKYLQEEFAENYTGLDDDMPDRFDHWIENMDIQELIDLAEEYGKEQYFAGKESVK